MQLALLPALASAARLPPAPRSWVTDQAGLLPAGTRQQLTGQLAAFQRASGYQVVVWIGQSTEGEPLEEWAARAFQAWGIGSKGKDDGVVLFVLARDRRARIEVGYGLEDRIPDARASRIIREQLLPGMRAGNAAQAIPAAALSLMRAIAPEQVPGGAAGEVEPRPAKKPSLGSIILLGVVALAFLVLLVTNPSLALLLLFSIFSGGRGGGFSGGGFSGGGGRSGGGGASGSW